MKYILVITMHADPAMAPGYDEWGGTHIYMKELLDSFGERKINCIMVTRKSMALPDVEQYNEYCRIYRLQNGNAEPMDKSLLQYYHEENLSKIQALINEHGKPLIIHSVYWNSGRLAMELGQTNGVSFVHSVISNSRGRVSRGAKETVMRRAEYEQQIYEKAAWIICVSEHEQQDLIDFYAIPPQKICIAGQYIHEAFILPSHDTNGFPRLNSNIDVLSQEEIAKKNNNSTYTIKTEELFWNRKAFTYIGRMSFYKGIDCIIAAWSRLYNHYGSNCPPLWLAGGSVAEIYQVREKIKNELPSLNELERSGNLVWWGCLDVAGLSTLLLKTLVLVAHSQYEPGGRVVVEAMSEGVPVIATRNGFAKDYIENWRNGFLVDYADVDGLYLRMEHFVRQPFLSDALGRNARTDAKVIIKKWNFFDNHLMAYGIHSPEDSGAAKNHAETDYFKTRNINLFPYCDLPLSGDFIKCLFGRMTGQPALAFSSGVENEYTSHIYRVQGPQSTVIFKQAFTRLSISPLFNPFSAERLVRRADRHFNIELSVYTRLKSDVLLSYDAEHYLLALKELMPIENADLRFVELCVGYLMKKKDIAAPAELDTFYQITQDNPNSYDNIMAVFDKLERELPNYYFEESGVFSETLGWAIAGYMLEYNRDILPPSLMRNLEETAAYFSSVPCCNVRRELKCINTDTELKHFMLNGELLEMLDYEKCSIGCIENEVACLFHDYLLSRKPESSSAEAAVLLNMLPSGLNKQKTIVSMAYRCFYEIIIRAVMRRNLFENELEQLEYLKAVSQSLLKP